ncbi:MAG: Fe2+-dependent dioxygenase [SAR86 cluster bacterium]|uniref:Fe2+-dependent dioxygenase n=1 Tax=SAR86 cluster bacterium TaxID=2030880 RepID=A0A2A5CFN8_9GAMM|nr:MAG: Fe2+-dependent dioxygenase [SAR86 cluster bacterium]
MLLKIPAVLSKEQIAQGRAVLEAAEWVDGNVTAGYQSSQEKNNIQLPEESTAARQVGDMILEALAKQLTFMSAALPCKIFPPLFNCYQNGHAFGAHVDNAVRYVKGTPVKIRTDLSMTLFFSGPEEYEGGELVIEDTYGSHKAKLAAGDMLLYPSTSLHHVTPVSSGRRLASFFWLESMVRSDEQRRILFDLDRSLQKIRLETPDHVELVPLTSVYHNLLRQWVST